MDRRRGFTLIELLVVIAIIALLMAMLMPALARVRKQAKAVVCMTKLKQWGNIFQIYTGENHGKWYQYAHKGRGSARWWLCHCEKYLAVGGLGTCPMADKHRDEGARRPYALAFKKTACSSKDWIQGSYCVNGWFMTFPRDRVSWQGQGDYDQHWHSVNVKQARIAPLFGDGMYYDAWPWDTDPPPPYIGWEAFGDNRTSRITAPRHNNGQNWIFADFHGEWYPFKCIWRIKWSHFYDITKKIAWRQYEYAKGWPDKCPQL